MKVKLKNWAFDQDGDSKLDSLSEKSGQVFGKVISFIGIKILEILLTCVFGTFSAMMKFVEGFNKGMNKQK